MYLTVYSTTLPDSYIYIRILKNSDGVNDPIIL